MHTNLELSCLLAIVSTVQIFAIVITVLLAVGIITCVLSHKMGARSWSDQRSRHQTSTRQYQQAPTQQQPYTYSLTPTTPSTMYTPTSVQERQRLEAGAHHDHLVRLHSVQNDFALNLPHSIALPDGEEGPRCESKFLNAKDPEEHAEITRSFIRPPPNRTVPDGTTLPPFRSNSVGLFHKPSLPPVHTDAATLVTRSHSVSSSNTQSCKLGYPVRQNTPISNPASSKPQLPSSLSVNSHLSDNSRNSNRTYHCIEVTADNKYNNTDPPPPYSDVVNEWDVNIVSKQDNSGV